MRTVSPAIQFGCRRLLTGLALMLMAPLTALAGTADLALVDASAAASQGEQTPWTLEKSGQLSGNTVNWTITATPGATQPGPLTVSGQMTVVNRGSGPATIGNIVVNLQVRSGSRWVTLASDIADATNGDAATTAKVMAKATSEGRSQFTESGASGALEFMDATNNTVFSLVPQVLIPAGGSRTLLFQAAFDNSILALPDGALVRAETLVSFGNATAKGNSVANVDINGNGTLDADEARIRSVPSRLSLTVATVNGNATPTLSDTLADIATTGTVTFSNAQFNLGTTSGTVTATVAGGVDGGTITNCAHLTTPDTTVNLGGNTFTTVQGLDLQACSQVQVGPVVTCTPGTAGCGWQSGALLTNSQAQWGTVGTSGANLLSNSFSSVYFAGGGVLEIGIAGTNGQSLSFTSGSSVVTYLPASGTASPLTNDVVNPTTTSAGILGGEVTALAINVDFSAAGLLGSSTTDLGDLTLCGVSGLTTMSVGSFLSIAENTLGGANTGYAPTQVVSIAQQVNAAFQDGVPSSFAQDHLVIGACPGGWNANDLVTYSQTQWGFSGTTAGALLNANFASLYGSAFEVGGFYTINFRTADSVFAYLPDTLAAGVLTGSLVDPTSSSGGELAGEVIALQFNADFSAADLVPSQVSLGSVYFCNTGLATLDGLTVDQFLAIANTLLGGGSAPYTPSFATGVARAVNDAFAGGTPSSFAQASLVAGPCPPPPCQPGEVGCGWLTGDLNTRTQLAWDSATAWFATYDTIYASTFGTVEVGIPGANGFSMRFSAGARVNDYFLQTGTPAALTKDLDDTSSSSSGQFGAEVLALRLNVDFSAAGQLGGTSGLSFGSLTLCKMSDPSLNGVTVNSVLGTANTLLGGGSAGSFTIAAIHDIVTELNFAFLDGTPSTYAATHLYNGTCP